MASTIYWTPSIEKLQQANNTSGKISEASIWHRKIRLMRKCHSWASWGSPSQKTEIQRSRLVSWDSLVYMAENTDRGVTDFRRGLRTISFSGVCNVSFTLCYQHKVKIHLPSLCVIRYCFSFSQRPTTTGQPSLLIFLPTFVLVCICKYWLFTIWKPHVWICVLAQIWPFVSDEFELLIDYLSIFISMMNLQMFFTEPSGLGLVCFSLGFAFCAALCCRRNKRENCNSSAVPICKICAYSNN